MTCSCRYTLYLFRAARRVLRSAHDDETETKEAPACRDAADRGFFFLPQRKRPGIDFRPGEFGYSIVIYSTK